MNTAAGSRQQAAGDPPNAERRTPNNAPQRRSGALPGGQRQLVSFLFYRLDPAWHKLPAQARQAGGREFLDAVQRWQQRLMVFSYTTAGLKTDSDFLLWRVGKTPEEFTAMSAELSRTGFGAHLSLAQSYLAMTRRSTYVDKLNPEHDDARLYIVPAQSKYLFVYPFVKTRDWYALPHAERQAMMDEHIRTGAKYRSVKLHTTYSFGLDDQEFVVAFETDQPADFLDLVMELRESKASRYTLRDTPIFTCVRQELPALLTSLGAL